jgi:hypothetical protein
MHQACHHHHVTHSSQSSNAIRPSDCVNQSGQYYQHNQKAQAATLTANTAQH